MIVTLHTDALQTLEQVQAFLNGSTALELHIPERDAAYQWISATLRHFRYAKLPRRHRGLLVRYLCKVTGISRPQITRLIAQFQRTGRLRDRRGPSRPFPCRYTAADVALLAEIDALHGTLSGPTTRKLCERALLLFGDARYQRLAQISNGHLYNLRHSSRYQRQRGTVDKTRPVSISIAQRRKPTPQGRPGFLRVDSVHQGDWDGIKGVYLIDTVDEVTQFQVVGAVERISERFLLPVLVQLLNAFPFPILGFHADNGSEYINHRVAGLLTKLHIQEFTKSRARQTNDNALVESKNGTVVRKHLGYAHIPGRYASAVNDFTFNVLSPYLNFHRPCFFPEQIIDAKGRIKKRYRYEHMMTPYQKLKSLDNAVQHLKPEFTFDTLDALAMKQSDNDAARELNLARTKLFRLIKITQTPAA
jgi:transposase InsO family protein